MDAVNLKYNTRNNLWYRVDDDTPYTGEIIQHYPNGQEDSKTRFNGGKIDGVTVSWYDNGNKKSEVNFSNGLRDGLATFWNSDSQIRTKALYKEGKMVLANSWDKEGREKDPLVEFYYENDTARNVLIVGDFTNWEDNPIRMDKVDSTLWFKRVILPKGEYEYKYKVDGEWVEDAFAAKKIISESGDENCLAVFGSVSDTFREDLIKKNTTDLEFKPPQQSQGWYANSI